MMPELKYILIDILPKKEQCYLEENLSAEPIQIIYVNTLHGELLAQLHALPAEECIFISENRTHTDFAISIGMATLVYLDTENEVQNTKNAVQNAKNAVQNTRNTVRNTAMVGAAELLEQDALSQKVDAVLAEPYQVPAEPHQVLAETHQVPAEPHQVPDMYAEGMEEVDLNFLCRIYQRHHRLPWTILETERCIVREFAMDYLDALFDLYAGKGMIDYMEPLHMYEQEREYQQSYIENMYRFYGYGMWIVCDKGTGKLIGRAGIEHREEFGEEPQLGYAIGVPYQRQGYATEVCRAVIDYARTELEIRSLCCLIEEKNEKSIGLAQKLGFESDGLIEINGKNHRKFRREI